MLTDVQHGIARHAEQVSVERLNLGQFTALHPQFGEDILRHVLRLVDILQHLHGEGLHTRGVFQEDKPEGITVPAAHPP